MRRARFLSTNTQPGTISNQIKVVTVAPFFAKGSALRNAPGRDATRHTTVANQWRSQQDPVDESLRCVCVCVVVCGCIPVSEPRPRMTRICDEILHSGCQLLTPLAHVCHLWHPSVPRAQPCIGWRAPHLAEPPHGCHCLPSGGLRRRRPHSSIPLVPLGAARAAAIASSLFCSSRATAAAIATASGTPVARGAESA